jgi:hypothetical protein
VDIVVNRVHPVFRMLVPNKDAIFHCVPSLLLTSRSNQHWCEEHEDAQHLPFSAQSSGLHLRTTVVSFKEYGGKQIPSSMTSQATVLFTVTINVILLQDY